MEEVDGIFERMPFDWFGLQFNKVLSIRHSFKNCFDAISQSEIFSRYQYPQSYFSDNKIY